MSLVERSNFPPNVEHVAPTHEQAQRNEGEPGGEPLGRKLAQREAEALGGEIGAARCFRNEGTPQLNDKVETVRAPADDLVSILEALGCRAPDQHCQHFSLLNIKLAESVAGLPTARGNALRRASGGRFPSPLTRQQDGCEVIRGPKTPRWRLMGGWKSQDEISIFRHLYLALIQTKNEEGSRDSSQTPYPFRCHSTWRDPHRGTRFRL